MDKQNKHGALAPQDQQLLLGLLLQAFRTRLLVRTARKNDCCEQRHADREVGEERSTQNTLLAPIYLPK